MTASLPSKASWRIAARRPRHWKDPATALVGAWLVASPCVLDYQGERPAIVNAAASGLVLVLVGVAAALCFRHWMEFVSAAVALWLLIAPWTLGFVNVKLAAWNGEVAGTIELLLALWTLLSRDTGEDDWPPGPTSSSDARYRPAWMALHGLGLALGVPAALGASRVAPVRMPQVSARPAHLPRRRAVERQRRLSAVA